MFLDLIERFEISWCCIAVSSVSVDSLLDCIKNMIYCWLSIKDMKHVIS